MYLKHLYIVYGRLSEMKDIIIIYYTLSNLTTHYEIIKNGFSSFLVLWLKMNTHYLLQCIHVHTFVEHVIQP